MDAATVSNAKPYRVIIRKPDSVREVEFSRYERADDAESAMKALRTHGIDARVASTSRSNA